MAMFKMTCDKGHEPMSWTTEAADENEAYTKFMEMPEVGAHVSEMHADMESMDPEEKKSMVMGMIAPADEEGGDMADDSAAADTEPAGSDMGGSDDAAQM